MHIDIKIPYSTRPSMTQRVGPAFKHHADLDKIQAKRSELAQHGSNLWGVSAHSAVAQLVKQAAVHCGRPVTDSIVDLALGFQEDLAIMHHGKLAAVCFCFPSGWIPGSKVNMTLAEIHQPVADNTDLTRMSDRLARTMADPVLGKFQRQVWTVTANPALSNLPGKAAINPPGTIDDLYFRWEDQTTEPLGDGASSLFFVDVNVVPLASVWPELGAKIVSSINSMTEAVLVYKNLSHIKQVLNRL